MMRHKEGKNGEVVEGEMRRGWEGKAISKAGRARKQQ